MSSAPATAKQKAYLKRLAQQTGTTFSPPTSKADASRQIKAMQTRPVLIREQQLEDRQSVWDRRGADRGVQECEIEGYGGSARWAR